jgi:hypothetical protein
MKNLKITMRNTLYLVLCVVLFTSCDKRPTFNGSKPFIVSDINKLNNTQCKYSGWANDELLKMQFVAPLGMYTVGDTVRLVK